MEAALKKDRSGCILYIYVDFWFVTDNHDLPLRHISIHENERLYSVEIFIIFVMKILNLPWTRQYNSNSHLTDYCNRQTEQCSLK